MPINVNKLTKEQAIKICKLEEGHFLDFKSIDVTPRSLSKLISAFANTDGGELYIGLDENKVNNEFSWRGFKNQETANGHIQIFETLFPLGHGFHYSFLSSSGLSGLVLYVEILKVQEIIYASDKIPYLRRGAQSLPQKSSADIDRLKFNKGLTTFETTLIDANNDVITNSENIIKFMLEVVPTSEPENWLRKQQLIKEGKPTVGGALLFADEPQALLQKRCSIKIYRYKTSDSEGTREALEQNPITIEGCLYEQIQLAVKETKSLIEGLKIMGTNGLEEARYPEETLHEIITNAVLHRDYSILDDIHVRIFDNRIEVKSPGKLPAHITVKNILDERYARNGSLVRIINKFPDPPNKDIGEGLNTAFQAMRKLKLKDPIIEESANSVTVKIKHERLASPEETILEYLENHTNINNRTARKLCYIGSENSMKRVFERLMKAKKIERIPELKGSASAYRKTLESN